MHIPSKNGEPTITSGMKCKHIGEYFVEFTYYTEDGQDWNEQIAIDWPTIKKIYTAMAKTAAQENDDDPRDYLG